MGSPALSGSSAAIQRSIDAACGNAAAAKTQAQAAVWLEVAEFLLKLSGKRQAQRARGPACGDTRAERGASPSMAPDGNHGESY